MKNILWFSELRKTDVNEVGGKSASLGEMYSMLTPKGINIPNGFSTTAHAYLSFLEYNGFDKKLKEIFSTFNPDDLSNLQETGRKQEICFYLESFLQNIEKEIVEAYAKLCKEYGPNCEVDS
jgi:pyruvate,water dikinase